MPHPGMMHDRTQNAHSRLQADTRNLRRANGQQRQQMPGGDVASQVGGGAQGQGGVPAPPAYGNSGLAERLAAMRAQAPAGGGRAGGVASAGEVSSPRSSAPRGRDAASQQQPMVMMPPPMFGPEMISRYVDELRRRLLMQSGRA